MLELKNIWIAYNKNVAVRDLTLTVNKGDFITILGANGAGKSSTLNAISGVVAIQQGEINFKGERINGLRPKSIASKGIIQIPEGRKLFPLMTVRENLLMGAFLRKDTKQIANSLEKLMVLFPAVKTKLNAAANSRWLLLHAGSWRPRSC
jgi:branched-chain amino acid transport system ATP-binding protein